MVVVMAAPPSPPPPQSTSQLLDALYITTKHPMALPPIDKAVLKNNPDFANLYGKLTNVVLNPDGSTRDDAAAREHARVKHQLDSHRVTAAKHHILTHALATLPPPPSDSRLPEPLLDLILLLPEILGPSSSPVDPELLSDLDTHLPDLADLLSPHLRSSALGLTRIAHPTANSTTNPNRRIPNLAAAASDLSRSAASARADLTIARLDCLATLLDLLDTYTTAQTRLIRALEARHGVVARSLDLGATEAALEAQRVKARAETSLHACRAEVYTPGARAALENYAAHLRDAKVRVGERVKGLAAELGEFGVGVEGAAAREKERTMREMARQYREMGRQMEDAKADLDRLRGK